MSAIVGFSGPAHPDAMNSMAGILGHRGQKPAGDLCFGTVSIRALQHGQEAGFGDGSFTAQEGRLAAGVSGILRRGDISQVLQHWEARGPQALEVLRGQFVVALSSGDELTLARDPAGERTIYYGFHEGRVIFGVEPKAILAFPGFPRRLEPASVARYLTFSFQPGAPTMIQHLYEVPPGVAVTFREGRMISEHRYFNPEREAAPVEPMDWVEEFRERFSAAVAERLTSNQDPAIFLSGGIDSSVVTAEVARQSGRPVNTYAIHFGERYPHELEHARAVAEHCGTRHREVLVEPKHFVPRLRKIIWHLDDPIGDPVTMPNFELSRIVSEEASTVFNGEGGDPLFGGPKNIPLMMHHWYGGVERGARFREQRYLESYRRAYDDLERLLTPEFRAQVDFKRDMESILTPYFETPTPYFLRKLLLINMRLKGAHLILPKVERMTAAWGLTPLAPLFDDQLIRLALMVPPKMLLNRGVEKVLLKESFRGLLPQSIIDRPKSGMRVPVHFWMKGEMGRYARKILSPKAVKSAGIFNPDRVKQLLRYDTEEGRGRYGLRLWMLITFEIWRRMVIEGEPV